MWRTIRTQLSLTLGVGLAGGFLFYSCSIRKPRPGIGTHHWTTISFPEEERQVLA